MAQATNEIDRALVFAHTGHTLVDLAVFLGPVAVITAWLLVERARARRARSRDGGGSDRAGGAGSGPEER
jgi:hypothetical protein